MCQGDVDLPLDRAMFPVLRGHFGASASLSVARPVLHGGGITVDGVGAVVPLPYAERILSDAGLQAYFRLSDAYSDGGANAAVAPTALVDSKQGLTLTPQGSPSYMGASLLVDDLDAAVSFNGTNAYAVCSDTSKLNLSYNTPFRLSFLLKPNVTRSGTATYVPISKTDQANSGIGWEVQLFYSSGKTIVKICLVNTSSARIVVQSTIDIPNNVVSHILITFSGNQSDDTNAGVRIYINGVYDSAATIQNNNLGTASSTSTVGFTIGARPDGTLKYTGVIDEVALATGARSAWGSVSTAPYRNLETEHAGYLYALAVGRRQLASAAGVTDLFIGTDGLTDPDDFYALGIAHALRKGGFSSIKGVAVNSSNPYSAAAIEAVNRFSGAPQIPIGAYQGSGTLSTSTITQPIAAFMGLGTKDRAQYQSGVEFYRRMFKEATGTFVLIEMGFLTNLAAFLQSGADAIEMARDRRLVIEATTPNDGSIGYNIAGDISAAQYVAANWPGEIILMPDNAASKVLSGPPPGADPATNIYAYIAQTLAPSLHTAGRRNSWGPMAMLLAALGPGPEWDYGGLRGTWVVNGDGTSTWSGAAGNTSILRPRITNQAMGALLDRLLAAA
jgi:hypothetical protein